LHLACLSFVALGSTDAKKATGATQQVARMRDYHGKDDVSMRRYVNYGILNKAFYETAQRLGTAKAGDIWIAALKALKGAKKADFPRFAVLLGEVTAEADRDALRDALLAVGLDSRANGATKAARAPQGSNVRPQISSRIALEKEMIDLLRELPPALLVALAVTAIGSIVVVISLVVWAVLQGREVSLWPPRVGSRADVAQQASTVNFRDQLLGRWWSLRDRDPSAIGFVTIAPYQPTATIQLVGVAYNEAGDEIATWESQACCLDPEAKKVYYYWTGGHPTTPDTDSNKAPKDAGSEIAPKNTGSKNDGFSILTFVTPDFARGEHIDRNLQQIDVAMRKTMRLQRCAPDDAAIMSGPDNRERRALVVRSILSATRRSAGTKADVSP